MRRASRGEAGYTLVEVMVSILILSIAIIPMVGMFDMGLTTATRAGNYDEARALAEKQLEKVQSGSYPSVRSSFPSGCPGGVAVFGTADGVSNSTECVDAEFPDFSFDVQKRFLEPPDSDGDFAPSDEDRGLMRIEVTVRWDGGPYSVTGLKTR